MVRSIHNGSEWWKEFLRLWRVVQWHPDAVFCWRKRRAGSRRRRDPDISQHYPTACRELPGDDRPQRTITIDVPLSNVNEPGAIDNRLHEVTASTMTLQERANTVPPVAGIGGSLFNLSDVAQGYTFDPTRR